MVTFHDAIMQLPGGIFYLGDLQFRPIQNDADLWYATVECALAPEQQDFVNPAGFSIGRAYLRPESHVPCVILLKQERIGYIMLRTWHDGNAASWSYYLDQAYQGLGYGRVAARLAVQILKTAAPHLPIKLSAEQANEKAHRLYRSIGFQLIDEKDGNDLVFQL